MSRTLCITSADGQTGHLLSELLLTDAQFNSKIKKLYCVAFDPKKCDDLREMGAEIITHKQDHKVFGQELKATGADTIFLVPPAHMHKLSLSKELVWAVKDAEIKNTVLLSSAGTEFAESKRQPHLRQFVKIEDEVMQLLHTKGTQAVTSQCIIR